MAEEPNNDRYEGRPLIAFNALIDGQKRTLWSLETAIEKYSRVNMEIAKFSRRLNAVQAEMLAQTDTFQGDLFARMANINEGVLAELGKLSANMDELSGRIDTLGPDGCTCRPVRGSREVRRRKDDRYQETSVGNGKPVERYSIDDATCHRIQPGRQKLGGAGEAYGNLSRPVTRSGRLGACAMALRYGGALYAQSHHQP